MLELDGSRIEVLRLGLQSAFGSPDLFELFLYEKLEKRLTDYAGRDDSFRIAVFRVIVNAQAEGWLDELVRRSYQARPKNRNIADIAKALGITIDISKLEPADPVQHEPPLWKCEVPALSPEVSTKVCALLTRFMGPISRHLVWEESQCVASLQELSLRLAARIPEEKDRALFIASVRAL